VEARKIGRFAPNFACRITYASSVEDASEPPIRVLVVEDDASVAAGVVRGLRAAGMIVELASDGESGARQALAGGHDVVVLDLMLPLENGFAVLERIHGRCAAPVIVLTARTELSDRLKSFALGASDFVGKPFFVEELVARIRSRVGAKPPAPKRVVAWANVVVDLDARVVTVAGVPASLTKHEHDVLACLLERAGRAVSRGQLGELTGVPFEERDARTIDSHVARVRKKLGAEGAAAIVTVWGVGYRFESGEHA
jgi:DNA-binding response OmpR family regulator